MKISAKSKCTSTLKHGVLQKILLAAFSIMSPELCEIMEKKKSRWTIINVSKGMQHDEGEAFKINGFPTCCPNSQHCMQNI